MQTPILGQSYLLRSPNAADNRLVNLYPEVIVEGGKQPAYLTRAPGLRRLATLGNGPVRGLWQTGDYGYAVSGNTFYKITPAWGANAIGSVAGFGPVSMADNGLQIFIAANPYGYIYDIKTNILSPILDPDFPGAVTVGFLDGYFVFNEPNSQRVWITALYDGANIDALDFASAEGSPDGLVAVAIDHREAWLFGTNSVEVWYDSGATDFPLERIQGAYNEIGCVAAYSVAKLDNGLFWLGADARGRGIVYRANGYTGQRISTHAVEWAIQQYSNISDAIGYTYQQDGHAFYVLIFPTARTTWVYDVATQAWHERAGWENGGFVRHRSNCQMSFASEIVVGDYNNGKIYAFDKNVYTDDGDIQKWLRSWRALPSGQNDLKRTAQHSLQIDFGVGSSTVQNTPSITPEPFPSAPVTETYWLATIDTGFYDQFDTTTIRVDVDNNVYVRASSYGGYTNYTTFIASFTQDFTINYSFNYTDFMNDGPIPYITDGPNIIVDATQNLYAGCAYNFSLNSGSTVAKFNSSGTETWGAVDDRAGFPSPTVDAFSRFNNFGLDSAGNIICVGCWYQNYLTFVSGSLISKFNASGTHIWDFIEGAPPISAAGGVSVPTQYGLSGIDSSDNIYFYTYASYFDGFTDNVSAYLGKLNSSGTQVWFKKLYETSSFSGGNYFMYNFAGPSVTNSAGVTYIFVNYQLWAISANGTVLWQYAIQKGLPATNPYICNIALDSVGNIYCVGTLTETDMIIIKFDSAGTILWQRNVTSDGPYFSRQGITLDSADNLYVSSMIADAVIFAAKLPSDGNITGTYSVGGYSVTFADDTFATSAVSVSISPASTVANTYSFAPSYQNFTASTANQTASIADTII